VPRCSGFFLSALLLAPGAAASRAENFIWGAPPLKLSGSPSTYSLLAGGILKDGKPLSGPGAAAEAERARRVALFYVTLLRRPFFFAPPGGSGGVSGAVALLVAEEKQAVSRSASKGRLYPSAFLQAYAAATDAFPALGGGLSESSALNFLKLLKLAVKAYGSDAAAVSKSIAGVSDPSRADLLAALGGANLTTMAIIQGDMGLIRKNAVAAAEEISALEKCLLKSSQHCSPGWPAIPVSPAFLQPSEGTELLDPGLLSLDRPSVRGPYAVYSGCWGGRRENLLYYSERDFRGQKMEWAALADNAYYRRPRPGGADEKLLLARGFHVVAQSATTDYTCNDLEYKPVLQLLDYFTVKYSSAPFYLSGPAPGSPAPAAISALREVEARERLFFSGKIKSQYGVEKLGRAYLAALESLGGEAPAASSALLERARLISSRTAGLARAINRVSYHLSNFNLVQRREEHKLNARHYDMSLFLTRSHYSLLFLSFSPTVWRISARPAYLSGGTVSNPMWLDYRSAAALYGTDELKRSMDYFLLDAEGREFLLP